MTTNGVFHGQVAMVSNHGVGGGTGGVLPLNVTGFPGTVMATPLFAVAIALVDDWSITRVPPWLSSVKPPVPGAGAAAPKLPLASILTKPLFATADIASVGTSINVENSVPLTTPLPVASSIRPLMPTAVARELLLISTVVVSPLPAVAIMLCPADSSTVTPLIDANAFLNWMPLPPESLIDPPEM